ncbi:MAG: N-ethylammeline chlorohydrolase [marine bacterium B5-7]|nr:MAG: N-ethylammeline chlorohydrolase [marine bacterium B5-7]
MNESYLVRGRWLVTAADEPVLSDAALLIEAGRVAAAGDWQDLRDSHPDLAVVGGKQSAILPGLINAHHHSHSISGIQHGVGDDLLEPWILALHAIRPLDRYLNTLVSLGVQLGGGVTSLVDMMSYSGDATAFADTLRAALRACDTAGIRVALAAGASTDSHLVSGRGEDARFLASLPNDVRQHAQLLLPSESRLDEADYFALMEDFQRDFAEHSRVDLWYGPSGPQWVSEQCLQRCDDAARRWDCGIQTHVNESFYEKLLGPRAYGKPTMQYLHELGVLSPRLSIAHGTWLSLDEIELMAQTGVAVSHNPSSNLRLRAGIAPFTEMMRHGVTVGIGMDGTTLNENEDMFTELRLALRLQCDPRIENAVPGIADVLSTATLGGARLLGKQHEIGRLQPGYAADLVILDCERLCWPWTAPEADPLELILLRAERRDIREVIIDGETVWRDGAPTLFNLDAAAAELAARAAAEPFARERAAAVQAVLPHLRAWYAAWDRPELHPWRIQSSKT